MLIRDLQLGQPERRHILKEVMEASIPMTKQDVVLVFVSVAGIRERPPGTGNLCEENLQPGGQRPIAVRHPINDRFREFALCVEYGESRVNYRNTDCVRQEQASLSDFLANRFGRYYARLNQATS